MNQNRILFRAAMIADGDGIWAKPGAVLVEDGRIVASGRPEEIGEAGEGTECRVVDLPKSVILPGLVNVHCHLDLSYLGPRQYSGDFAEWVGELQAGRARTDEEIDAAVRRGVELSRAGGTAMVGDIAGIGSMQPVRTLRESGMAGVSFLEVFGLGDRQAQTVGVMRRAVGENSAWENGVGFGLQPHAPYSCGLEVYRAAADLGRPLATHLAETLDEIEFVRFGTGRLARMLRGFGAWDDAMKALGAGRHPIDYLAEVLCATPIVAAHLNYIEEGHLELMKGWPITVAYCPRASAYFGHGEEEGERKRGQGEEGKRGRGESEAICSSGPAVQALRANSPHRFQEMMELGINVALGTDSIVCLDTPERLSVLDEMRLLYRRDGVDPRVLLRMATVNGAKGLGIDEGTVTLGVGRIAGLIAVDFEKGVGGDPMRGVLMSNAAPRWVYGPVAGAV